MARIWRRRRVDVKSVDKLLRRERRGLAQMPMPVCDPDGIGPAAAGQERGAWERWEPGELRGDRIPITVAPVCRIGHFEITTEDERIPDGCFMRSCATIVENPGDEIRCDICGQSGVVMFKVAFRMETGRDVHVLDGECFLNLTADLANMVIAFFAPRGGHDGENNKA